MSCTEKNDNELIKKNDLRELSIEWKYRFQNSVWQWDHGYYLADNTTRFPYSGIIKNSGTIKEAEDGWFLPLKKDKKFTDYYTQDTNNYTVASTKILNPLVFGQGDTYGNSHTIVYTTETIYAGNKDNLCTPDIRLMTFGHINIFDGTPSGKTLIENEVETEKAWFTHGLNPTLIIAPLRTLNGINADNQLGNISSGINLTLKSKERMNLDGVFNQATINKKNVYVSTAATYVDTLLKLPEDKSAYYYHILYPYDSINPYFKYDAKYSENIFQSYFSDSSMIGGRRFPVFYGARNDYPTNKGLDYEFYEHGGYGMNRWDHHWVFYTIPASGPFGMYGDSDNIKLFQTNYMEEPEKKELKPKRLNFRKIF